MIEVEKKHTAEKAVIIMTLEDIFSHPKSCTDDRSNTTHHRVMTTVAARMFCGSARGDAGFGGSNPHPPT